MPTMPVAGYQPPQSFRAWADLTGYGTIAADPLGGRPTRAVSTSTTWTAAAARRRRCRPATRISAEATYWDLDGDGYVSDDERDEDGDGLNNYDESHGADDSPGWWRGCYPSEAAYPDRRTRAPPRDDADTDGDGILDGADDQDFDDVPNVMELSRNMAGDIADQGTCDPRAPAAGATLPYKTCVNPFNPCLPDPWSRTCQRHPVIGATATRRIDPDWKPYVLN